MATGQAVTLVTDGTKFHVVAYACGPAPAPPASSASTSSGASTSTATLASLELRIARMEAAAAGGSLSYDVSFTLTVESSVDAATYDVSGLKAALALLVGVSESHISITVVAGSLVVTISSPSPDAAAKLVSRLDPVVTSRAAASATLGITVLSVTAATTTPSVVPAPAAPPDPPSPPSPPPRPPMSPLPPTPPSPPAPPPSPPQSPSPFDPPPSPPTSPPPAVTTGRYLGYQSLSGITLEPKLYAMDGAGNMYVA